MLFQIRPAGAGAPLIDPKPILDGWVQLEETSVFRAKGENPFLGTSPTVGQVLLESKPQLEQQVLSDPGIHLPACGRQEVRAGEVDRRVLATLEFLSVSGLNPTVSALAVPTGLPRDGRQRRRLRPAMRSTCPRSTASDRRARRARIGHRYRGAQAVAAAGHDEARARSSAWSAIRGPTTRLTLPG